MDVKSFRIISAAGENFGFLTPQKPGNGDHRGKIIEKC